MAGTKALITRLILSLYLMDCLAITVVEEGTLDGLGREYPTRYLLDLVVVSGTRSIRSIRCLCLTFRQLVAPQYVAVVSGTLPAICPGYPSSVFLRPPEAFPRLIFPNRIFPSPPSTHKISGFPCGALSIWRNGSELVQNDEGRKKDDKSSE